MNLDRTGPDPRAQTKIIFLSTGMHQSQQGRARHAGHLLPAARALELNAGVLRKVTAYEVTDLHGHLHTSHRQTSPAQGTRSIPQAGWVNQTCGGPTGQRGRHGTATT